MKIKWFFIKKKYLIIFLIIVLLLIFTFIFINLLNNSIDEEKSYAIRFNGSNAVLWRYKTTPKNVYKSAKKFIEINNFDSNDMIFSFVYVNHLSEYEKKNYKEEARYNYCVVQNYKGVLISYFIINKDGEIIFSGNLKTADALSTIQFEPILNVYLSLIPKVQKYLKLDSDTHMLSCQMFLIENPILKKIRVYYKIGFGENIYTREIINEIFVDAITGEILDSYTNIEF